jgi:hypothetical protein
MSSQREPKGRRRRIAIAAVALVALLLAVEVRLGLVTGYRIPGHPVARSPSLWLELRELLGLQDFYSQLGQDKWILGEVFPGVEDGFFVDVGSWDARIDSNSKALEERGWSGICVDPFPRNWVDRRCQLFREVAYDRPGETIEFRVAGAFGGIDEHIGHWRQRVEGRPVVEFRTTTLGDVLARAGAPRFIHYVSIDTEGSEYEVLQGFPFEQYRVGAFSIEHNYEQPKRRQIGRLLDQHGYRFVREQLVDDWYRGGDGPDAP